MKMNKYLEIRDKIRYKNAFSNYNYIIQKVTKTKAIGKLENGQTTMEFKREYFNENSIRRFTKMKWDTTEITLIKC